MIDSILTAPYPDATPLTVEDAHSLLLHKGDFEHLLPNGTTEYYYKYRPDPDGPALQDAFIMRPDRERLLWKQSLWPLAGFAATAALIIVPTAINLWKNWDGLDFDTILWGNIVLAALIVVAAWGLFSRWMKVALTLILTLDADSSARMLDRQAAGSAHVKSQVVARDYTPAQRTAFLEATPHKDHFRGLGFEVPFVVTMRGSTLLHAAWRERERRLSEATQLVQKGLVHDRSSSRARAFDSRAATAVTLDRYGLFGNVLSFVLGMTIYFGGAALLALFGSWIIDAFGLVASWPFLIGIACLFAALFVFGTAAMGILILIYRLIAGHSLDYLFGNFRSDHRVRIRFADGKWMTLLRTPRQVVAVELYNLVARDIRRAAE